ncbi:unnamed protein product [Sphacelaria rigidula]
MRHVVWFSILNGYIRHGVQEIRFQWNLFLIFAVEGEHGGGGKLTCGLTTTDASTCGRRTLSAARIGVRNDLEYVSRHVRSFTHSRGPNVAHLHGIVVRPASVPYLFWGRYICISRVMPFRGRAT